MLLAIDTSTSFCGLAVYGSDGPVGSYAWRTGRNQSNQLLPAIESLLRLSRVEREELRGIGVATGPGSFTGVRVGLAAAKGLSLSLDIPLIGIQTLFYTAWPHRHIGRGVRACAALGRRRLAVAAFSEFDLRLQWMRNLTPMEAAEAGPLLYCGEITDELKQALHGAADTLVLSPAEALRSPEVLGELAWNRLLAGDVDSPALQAEYLVPG